MPCNLWIWFGSLFWRHLGKIQRLFLISNVSAVNMVGRRGSSPSPNLSATDVKQKETPLTANVATSDTKSRMSPVTLTISTPLAGNNSSPIQCFFPVPCGSCFPDCESSVIPTVNMCNNPCSIAMMRGAM